MKRKQLYNYIREEIISELSLAEASPEELKAKTLSIANDSAEIQELNKQIAAEKDPKKKAVLQAQLVVVKQDLVKQQNIKESSLEEMARKANTLKVDNQDKFTAAKNLYANSWIGELLNAVEEAGEEGISIKSLTEKVGKKASANINPLIQELKSIGAIASTRITGEPEVEEPEAEEPETTTPESDFFITDTDDEEEKEEKEPTDSDEDEDNKAYKGAKKVDDKETKKSDEKIKAINDAVAIVKKKVDRIKDIKKKNPKNYKNTDEYIVQMEKLKQYVQKYRSILTKKSTISILTGELIS